MTRGTLGCTRPPSTYVHLKDLLSAGPSILARVGIIAYHTVYSVWDVKNDHTPDKTSPPFAASKWGAEPLTGGVASLLKGGVWGDDDNRALLPVLPLEEDLTTLEARWSSLPGEDGIGERQGVKVLMGDRSRPRGTGSGVRSVVYEEEGDRGRGLKEVVVERRDGLGIDVGRYVGRD
eukprot:CAMPEP_0184672656 /NCGR_PEP_ID=MMETSP0308-20130426/86232_1 /TAXON_ID=38269 /ORGANISM="Gloeochaete witrockiana, Strain SAG 46.84" /LENGTH=176 /DNA_ID=CAMNT_0027120029 /DNA_START=1045 /DNA_END=1576 /DNA_ORIENTATION=-